MSTTDPLLYPNQTLLLFNSVGPCIRSLGLQFVGTFGARLTTPKTQRAYSNHGIERIFVSKRMKLVFEVVTIVYTAIYIKVSTNLQNLCELSVILRDFVVSEILYHLIGEKDCAYIRLCYLKFL